MEPGEAKGEGVTRSPGQRDHGAQASHSQACGDQLLHPISAQALGLTIPQSLLQQVDEVIQ